MTENTAFQLLLCSMIVLLAGLHWLYHLRRLWSISMIDVAIWMSAMFFGIGPWIACVYSGGELPYVAAGTLMAGYVCVYLYLLGLFLVQLATARRALVTPEGQVIHSYSKFNEIIHSAPLARPSFVLVGWTFAWALRLIFATKYGMFFSGSRTLERQLSVPYALLILRGLADLIAFGALLWAAVMLWSRGRGRWLAIAVLVMEALFCFAQGRRVILEYASVLSLSYFLVKGHTRLRYLLGFAAFIYLLWLLVLPAFFEIRYNLTKSTAGSAFGDLHQAVSKYWNADGSDRFERKYEQNVATRPLILNFNFAVHERQQQMSPLFGRAMVASVVATIPRILMFGQKTIFNSEAYIQREYGMPMVDASSNWPATGLADFGVIGGLFAGLVFGAAVALSEHVAWLLRLRYPLFALCLAGTLISLSFQVETVPDQTWGYLRNNAILFVLIAVASIFTGAPQPDPQPEPQPLAAYESWQPDEGLTHG